MSERGKHLFQFTAAQIVEAAKTEAAYHETRGLHWAAREQNALARVEATIGASVAQHEVTGGQMYSVTVNHGDPEAWAELCLAADKTQTHRRDAERYRTDERLYGTQPSDRVYELDSDDVHHFRLGGEPREA